MPSPPRSIASRVGRWYDKSARDLPWRRPGVSPWAVLVSEVMLQQTPVARVLPAYDAWLTRWPVPAALAAEPAGEAVRQWGRLGYPRRALALHRIATAITTEQDGTVPSDLEALLALPGIGAYTARAVAVFAFGQRHPVVDTNVRRVLARHALGLGLPGSATTTVTERARVAELLPADPASAVHVSVALMELGALVCTARRPRCDDCPIAVDCTWRLAGSPVAPSPRSQGYAGTDREARGRLLAVLRATAGPVRTEELAAAWPVRDQRKRALAGLVSDGLAVAHASGSYTLPD